MTRKLVSILKVLLTANWSQDRKNSLGAKFWDGKSRLRQGREPGSEHFLDKKLDSDEEENGVKFIFRLDKEEYR